MTKSSSFFEVYWVNYKTLSSSFKKKKLINHKQQQLARDSSSKADLINGCCCALSLYYSNNFIFFNKKIFQASIVKVAVQSNYQKVWQHWINKRSSPQLLVHIYCPQINMTMVVIKCCNLNHFFLNSFKKQNYITLILNF